MIKMMLTMIQAANVYSQYVIPGSDVDSNECITSAGYTWCQSSNSCVRVWETPCSDNFKDCHNCLFRQRNGENIACPPECDIVTDPTPHPMPYPTQIHPTDPLPQACSDVMCMIYCEHGHQLDQNGCQLCQCIERIDIDQPTCNNVYTCPKVTELYTDKVGYTTYKLSLMIQPNTNIKNIYAIYGNNQNNVGEQMYIPGAYQEKDVFGSNIGGVNENLININPESKHDSWLTIDITDGDPNNLLSTIGIDFGDWSENNGISIDNGAIYMVDPHTYISNTECIIGQLTIHNEINTEMLINVQGKFISDESWHETKIVFRLNPPGAVQVNVNAIPLDCILWYDGCNVCITNNGVLGGCSRLMCLIDDDPVCRTYKPNGH